DAHSFASKRVQECNWFQAMEGGIDSSHISFLHAPLDPGDAEVTRALDLASFGVGSAVQTADRAPRFEVVDTDYGVLIGAQRSRPPQQRLRDGLGRAPDAHVLRHSWLRRPGPGDPGEPGRHRRPRARAPGLERYRDHPGAPAPDERRARAARSRDSGTRERSR